MHLLGPELGRLKDVYRRAKAAMPRFHRWLKALEARRRTSGAMWETPDVDHPIGQVLNMEADKPCLEDEFPLEHDDFRSQVPFRKGCHLNCRRFRRSILVPEEDASVSAFTSVFTSTPLRGPHHHQHQHRWSSTALSCGHRMLCLFMLMLVMYGEDVDEVDVADALHGDEDGGDISIMNITMNIIRLISMDIKNIIIPIKNMSTSNINRGCQVRRGQPYTKNAHVDVEGDHGSVADADRVAHADDLYDADVHDADDVEDDVDESMLLMCFAVNRIMRTRGPEDWRTRGAASVIILLMP